MLIPRPEQAWASDITPIPLQHGFLHLTAVMDVSSRNVPSWPLSHTLTGDLCVESLDAVLADARPEIFSLFSAAKLGISPLAPPTAHG